MVNVKKAGYANSFEYCMGNLECKHNDGDKRQDCPISWSGKYNNISYKQLNNVNSIMNFIDFIVIVFQEDNKINVTWTPVTLKNYQPR